VRLPALVLLVMLLAIGSPLVAGSRIRSAVQNAQTIKWKFGGNDAGTSTYVTRPDGTFESSTELNVAGTSLKSRLTGKLVDGALTEFELSNQQAGAEVKSWNVKLDAAIGNMLQGLAMYDSQQRLVVCNKRYTEMYGLSLEQVKPGTPLREILAHRIARGEFRGRTADEEVRSPSS